MQQDDRPAVSAALFRIGDAQNAGLDVFDHGATILPEAVGLAKLLPLCPIGAERVGVRWGAL